MVYHEWDSNFFSRFLGLTAHHRALQESHTPLLGKTTPRRISESYLVPSPGSSSSLMRGRRRRAHAFPYAYLLWRSGGGTKSWGISCLKWQQAACRTARVLVFTFVRTPSAECRLDNEEKGTHFNEKYILCRCHLQKVLNVKWNANVNWLHEFSRRYCICHSILRIRNKHIISPFPILLISLSSYINSFLPVPPNF